MADSLAGKRQTESTRKAIFSRAVRLRKPSQFKRVFSKPQVYSDPYFKVLVRINDVKYSRLGMAVSRHVDKRAVGRNRIKRIVRESFRCWAAENPGMDIVVLPRKETATSCNDRLFHSLERHWSRLEDAIRKLQNSNPAKCESAD